MIIKLHTSGQGRELYFMINKIVSWTRVHPSSGYSYTAVRTVDEVAEVRETSEEIERLILEACK